jgi:sulfatase maturation enzyme AslB (radical SAM superfamily)
MSDILEFCGRKSRDEIIKKLEKRHSTAALEEGLHIIDRLNRQYGLFSSESFETRIKWITQEEVAIELSQGISNICLEVTEACNLRCEYCAYSGGYQLGAVALFYYVHS